MRNICNKQVSKSPILAISEREAEIQEKQLSPRTLCGSELCDGVQALAIQELEIQVI